MSTPVFVFLVAALALFVASIGSALLGRYRPAFWLALVSAACALVARLLMEVFP